MPAALVPGQVASVGGGSAATLTVTLPNTPTPGNLIVVLAGVNSAVSGISGADSNSNSYALTPNSPQGLAGAGGVAILYLANAPANATKSITVTVTGTVFTLWAAEFSGIVTSSPLELDVGATGGTAGPVINTPSITTVNNGDLLVNVIADAGNATAVLAPWTTIGSVLGGSYFLQAFKGPQATAYLQASNTWVGLIAAFKAVPPTPIGKFQIAGRKNSSPLEVEANTHAARFVMRPTDYDLCGAYSIAGYSQIGDNSGGTFTGSGNAYPTQPGAIAASFLCGAPDVIYWVKRINISGVYTNTTTSGADHLLTPSLFRIHGAGVQFLECGCTTSTPVALAVQPLRLSPQVGGHLRSSMRDSTADIILPATTSSATNLSLGTSAAVSTGTQVTGLNSDTNPLTTVLGGYGLTTTRQIVAPQNLLDFRAGEQPVILNGRDALVIGWPNTIAWTVSGNTVVVGFQFYWEEYEMRIGGR